ncbi:hypothetical protein PI124_g22808 [Phytophthora idaei]|nr:hypothetical protein PI125_g24722 [Phytophthora idaei]KAG3125442.1 hypothetical protein PI126_g22760 [Phytophthora idaei]KAG3232104.1 hypothetical protein PI124_g22808 [Phytophthora idaei]
MPPLHSRYHSFVSLLSSADKDLRIMTFSLFIAALCEWENKAVKCDSATFCQKSDKHTGYCMKKKPGLGDQCGGKGADGPWAVPCNGDSLKCVLESDTTSKCQKSSE